LHRLGETWWLGLRRSVGVDPGEALLTAGLDGGVDDPAPGLARELEQQGLLEEADGRWRLTDRGWPLADGVARKFLELGG
jgi:coproporphyrinogen III oxidase-like Fe-S oxidoreductase